MAAKNKERSKPRIATFYHMIRMGEINKPRPAHGSLGGGRQKPDKKETSAGRQRFFSLFLLEFPDFTKVAQEECRSRTRITGSQE